MLMLIRRLATHSVEIHPDQDHSARPFYWTQKEGLLEFKHLCPGA